jgi:hypothetical protein
VHDSQAAQRFDKMQLARIEASKRLVTLEQCGQLRRLFRAIAGQEHPKVLHRRATSRVIEVDDMKCFTGDQDVTGMKVGMQPDFSDITCTCIAFLNALDDKIGHTSVGRMQVAWNKLLLEQIVAGFDGVILDRDPWPVLEFFGFADQVYTRDEAPELSKLIVVIEFRGTSTSTRKDCESERARPMQRLSVDFEWSNDWNLLLAEFHCEAMFLENGIVAPSVRTVEFCDDGLPVINTYLVYAVFVAVEREKAAVAMEAEDLERGKKVLRL